MYVALPLLGGGSFSSPRESGTCSLRSGYNSHSHRCDCSGRAEGRNFREALQDGSTCLACCMELLPRLSAERNLLGTDDCDAPLNRVAADEGNAALKTRNQVPSNQQVQQASSECGADKKRLEFQQALEVRFGPPSLASARNSTDRTSFPPAARPIHDGSDEHIGSFPPKACEERQKGETGGTQQDNDILDDDVTRTLVVAGAWGPGRHGLPPYAAIRGEVWGSFEFSVDPSPHSRLFTFEPSKGTVYHGSKQMIRVLFSPQNPTPSELQRPAIFYDTIT